MKQVVTVGVLVSMFLFGGGSAAYAVSDPNHGLQYGGSTVTLPTPPAGVTFSQVSAGLNHSLALGNDGKTYAWGGNTQGQLGDGTLTARTTPVLV